MEDISALTPRDAPSDEYPTWRSLETAPKSGNLLDNGGPEILLRTPHFIRLGFWDGKSWRSVPGRYVLDANAWHPLPPAVALEQIHDSSKAREPEPRGVRESKSSPPPPVLEGVEEDLRLQLSNFAEQLDEEAERRHDNPHDTESDQCRRDAKMLREATALLSALAGMREALAKAAEQFEFYASEHWAKVRGAEFNGMQANADTAREKALTNERTAKLCRAALAEGSAAKDARESTERGEADT